VVLLSGALTASSWLALETGEEEEELVEDVVGDDPIHAHEEAAELFYLLTFATLGVIAAGMVKGRPGEIARWAGCAAAIVVLYAGVNVGHTGGELVYVHGAGEAYVDRGADGWYDRGRMRRRDDADDDDRDDAADSSVE